jgi:hypothetical protein
MTKALLEILLFIFIFANSSGFSSELIILYIKYDLKKFEKMKKQYK